jgi:hypothetical protein
MKLGIMKIWQGCQKNKFLKLKMSIFGHRYSSNDQVRIGDGQVGEFNHEYFKIKNAMQFLNNIFFKIHRCFHNHHIYYPIFSFGHNES